MYNKPPKTASTYIVSVVDDWTRKTNRTHYRCSHAHLSTALTLRECLPRDGDSCGVITSHLQLVPGVRDILRTRLPQHVLLTSTRYPAHRIVSLYLEENNLTSSALRSPASWDKLREYLRTYNAWQLFNYNTGQNYYGRSALTEHEKHQIFYSAMQFDVVINAQLVAESNVILDHFGLFKLPAAEHAVRKLVRGAEHLAVPDDVKEMLRFASRVDIQLHRALLVRMASVYEKASGVQCVTHGRMPVLASCLEQRERDILRRAGAWLL